MKVDNSCKLSPAYDLTFSSGPGGEHSTTYLSEGRAPNMQHLQNLAKKHHIKEAHQIINEVKDTLANLKDYAKDVELSKESTKLLSKVFMDSL